MAALAVGGMSLGLYLTLRDEVLGNVRPPPRESGPDGEAIAPPGRFGRQDGRDPP
ncbi:MAG: hypothetical protein L3K08_08345 [Thermoplasmata archaeon]|nr:hypothetical protein [Thermoplasmata archaeon]